MESLKRKWRRFKHAYISNPFGYSTFWDYWNCRYKPQDILTETMKWKGRKAFLKEWFRVYKYRD